MWRKLLTGPWPDEWDLPQGVREQATQRIHQYWRAQIWPVILGEAIIWLGVNYYQVRYARAYGVPVLLLGLAYALGLFPNAKLIWLVSMVPLFALHGILINGLGGIMAISFMLPYTFAAIMLSGRIRIVVQALCVVGFWFNLAYEVWPFSPQLEPPRYFQVGYNVAIAALTFQGLRFLNRLAIELSMAHVEDEVTQRSQQFLARVSHELRTPLNSVLGFAKMLKRGSNFTEAQTGYLAQIVEEGEQLNRLVSDLLDSAQLSSGKLSLNVDACDVNSICQAVADEIQSILKPNVSLRTELTPGLPSCTADGLRLRQVVRNLVGNAAKYTTRGEIVIRTAQHGNHIEIAVSDTGPGIPEDQQALVFVPFVKLDGRSAGVGLGLDIARQIARLHGGDIRLESQIGVGSTFIIELPTKSAQTQSLQSEEKK